MAEIDLEAIKRDIAERADFCRNDEASIFFGHTRALLVELNYTAMQRNWLLAEASSDIRQRYFRLMAENKALRIAAALSVEGKDTSHDH